MAMKLEGCYGREKGEQTCFSLTRQLSLEGRKKHMQMQKYAKVRRATTGQKKKMLTSEGNK